MRKNSALGRLTALLLCALLTVGLSACGIALPGGQGGASASGDMTENVRPGFLSSFAPSNDTALTAAVPSYTVADDFSNIVNYSDMYATSFSDSEKEKLRENGFVVWGSNYGAVEFYGKYEENRYEYMPNFVTTDSLMHTYHLYFTKLLKDVEKSSLYPALGKLSDTMLAESEKQLETLRGTAWENAAKRNTAFFAVAVSLLTPDAAVPAEVQEVVSQELALIDAAAGIEPSPVMALGAGGDNPLLEDYSQYIPRSYYTSSEELTRYFKAMMWYGRLTFLQSDEDATRSALLMTEALETSPAMAEWEEIYTVTNFFVGASDDPGVYEYAAAAKTAYGDWPETAKLPGLTAQWKSFCATAAQLKAPVVNSIPVDEKAHAEEGDAVIKGFRFMGQRSTLDAAVFQQLVYQNVGANPQGEKRMLPSGLDLTAALGSDLSARLLQESGADEYEGYTENMTTLKNYFANASDTVWTGSLYNGWVNTLRPLTEAKGEGWPAFMQSDAWAAKDLNTFLGSWTELKHDTALYAKQVYAEMGSGYMPEERDDRGYVEPEAALYARLSALAKATSAGLEKYGMLEASDKENLSRLAELSDRLMTISEKELRGELPTDEEFDLIRTYGGQLEHFWSDALAEDAAALGKEMATLDDFPSALVTDVATDPNGSVLEEATGYVNYIYVIVPVDGTLRIASGTVYSYYEFEQPLDQRLTDRQWRLMLGIDQELTEDGSFADTRVDVPYPDWTSLFRA